MKLRVLAVFVLVLLVPGLILAQTSISPAISTSTASNDNDVKAMLKTMQEKLDAQQQQIESLQEQLATVQNASAPVSGALGLLDARFTTAAPAVAPLSPTHAPGTGFITTEPEPPEPGGYSGTCLNVVEPQNPPISFKIGGADFTPCGFMDFTSIFRTTNTGNLGTNFFAIPFSNAQQGHLTETRFTAQNSRLSLKAHDTFGENDVTGYFEMDFLGNDAANVFVTSNSHTFRLRQYWVDYKRGKWEILAGQAWSWLTPNRVGVSAYTSDVFYSQDMDFNYQVGLTWTRAPQIRFVYHPNEHWAMGVALENPEQFGGQGEITFPQEFNAQLANEIDSATISSTPNLHPDIIPKIAYDTKIGEKHFHLEAAGLIGSVKITDLPSVTGATFVSHTAVGGGVSGAVNLEIFKNFHLISNAFWSDGGGRYIFGMAPDAVFFPTNASGETCVVSGTPTPTPSGCDVRISLIHSYSGIAGFEWQLTQASMLYTYYGAMYAQRNSAADLTSTAATQPFIGFGYPDSSINNNRAIQEPTIGWIQTFWKNPQYGSMQLITQGSYLTRSPWFVAAGAPKNAHLTMVWLDLRYVLP